MAASGRTNAFEVRARRFPRWAARTLNLAVRPASRLHGRRHSKRRGGAAIAHHYDELGLGRAHVARGLTSKAASSLGYPLFIGAEALPAERHSKLNLGRAFAACASCIAILSSSLASAGGGGGGCSLKYQMFQPIVLHA